VAVCAGRLRLLAIVASSLGLMVLGFPGAEARTNADRAASTKKTIKPPPGPILAVVSLTKQRIWVYSGTGLIAQSAVSTGMSGYRTPTGVFSVVQKNRFHRSNIYSNAPMPYMQRITWSGVALHAGVVPGYPASHGCIRLPHHFAVELWGMTRIGARVVVVPDDASVFDIEHPSLPGPAMTPAPADFDQQAKGQQQAAVEDRPAGIVGVAHAGTVSDAPPVQARLLNPMERAKAARVQAVADAAVKAKAAKGALEASALKAAEASRAIGALRAAELAVAVALGKRDAAAKVVADLPEPTDRAQGALADAEAKLADAEKAAEEARATEAMMTPSAIAAARTAWEAEKANAQALSTLKATERNTEPITILVSKKAGRVYIRQAWAPIHEGPATFKSATPFGTHVYVAKAAEDNGGTLRWLSVSLPPSRPAEPRQGGKRVAAAQAPSPPVDARPQLTTTAAAALERFELSEETRNFIADRLWAGASLIVSDEGISHETGVTTDLIVLTR
jgi:hypothetical protein